jgi:type IV pilus assembly protein PilY1
MIRSKKIYYGITLLACLVFLNTFTGDAQGAFSCATGASDPPFLAAGVDPNLLLLIDNSASMYDMAYVNATGNYCNDDTYDGTLNNYAGYFDLDTWYEYIPGTQDYFKAVAGGSAALCNGKANGVYTGTDVCVAISEGFPSGDVGVYFAAKGNLLNWLAASKMDVQKQVLTGGKYEVSGGYGAPVDALAMESRGCTNQKFVKEVPVLKGASPYWLALAIRGPEEARFDVWRIDTNYAVGDIVTYQSELYQCQSGHVASQDDIDDTTGLLKTGLWEPYYGTRWKSGITYDAGDVVSYEGLLYIAENATSGATSPDNDTTNWTEYHLTHIEIMAPTVNGFDGGACQQAVEALTGDPPNLGQASQGIDDCLAYATKATELETNENAAFNHSLQTCWSWIKFPDTAGDVGTGEVQRIKNACEAIYDVMLPVEVSVWDDPGYVCYGWYNNVSNEESVDGYLGNCWDPGGKFECTKYKKDGTCLKWEYTAGGSPGWRSDECVARQLAKYCNDITVPEVVDPSDEVSVTGELFNLPAVLVDSGLGTQLGKPILSMRGYIHQDTAPTGLLHEFADDIRMGAMKFNNKGSDSECNQTSPFIDYACNIADDQDGAQLVYPIGKNATGSTVHTDGLVANVNDIIADSWTPIAEAVFSAVGYYTQNSSDFKLNADDWQYPGAAGDAPAPCTDWCQNNNILIITEGASTTDLNTYVANMAATSGDAFDIDPATECDNLYGSTFLDDLTWFAEHGYPDGSNIFGEAGGEIEGNYQNIKTFIVVAGTPRTEGAGECSPLNLLANAAYNGGTFAPFVADDPYDLQENLKTVFNLIRAGAAAGSAASVISATRGGEGAIYQAIFWPRVDGPPDEPEVAWTGEVHALLIDAYGYLYEDTNGDKALTYDTDGVTILDEKVTLYYDVSNKISKACYGDLNTDGTCSGTSKGLHEVKYLWSAAEWLSGVADPSKTRTSYDSTSHDRFIFTWNDLDNDGAVDYGSGLDKDEVLFFDAGKNWEGLSVDGSRAPVPIDFNVTTNAEVERIVDWIRGVDTPADPTLRPRQVPRPSSFSTMIPDPVTWRLGDVVHSTPTAVSRPSEGYHFLFKDFSYATFLQKYQFRRHVIYFGANDGMIHAINAGFYDPVNKQFKKGVSVSSGVATYTDSGPDLGAELWAYVPYNLLPHLECLTRPSYSHKYYVDLKPRVFDVRIFPSDATHPDGWGTILVVGMRFGGTRVYAKDLAGGAYPADARVFTSSYVIMDITDPEQPPVLLGELTFDETTSVDLAYTASVPSVVPYKDGSTYNWYLVLGSGPTETTGVSTQTAKIGVFPLANLVSGNAFRIPTTKPAFGTPGSWELTAAANGFVSDSVAVDYDLVENYKADVVYFGTIEGDWGAWDGRLYRWVTDEKTLDSWRDPNTTVMIDAERPIIAAPTIGSDGKNFWVYFGTGRFFDKKDKTDGTPFDDGSNGQEGFYGLKEPEDENGDFTWATISKPAIIGSTTNILRTDQILVESATSASTSDLSCVNGGTGCLPPDILRFDQLEEYVPQQTDGWYLAFSEDRERNLGQGALLGGLMTFTTYQPFDDVCKPEGDSFLYGVYYITGTGYYEPVFTTHEGGGTVGDPPQVTTKLAIGRGLATTPNLHVGRQEGSKAFVQTSTGTIVEIPQPNLPIKATKSGRMSWRSE